MCWALKENHPTLYADTTLWMNTEFDAGRLEVLETLETCAEPVEAKTTVAWKHAVTPSALAWTCPEPAEGRAGGAGLKALGMVESRREIKGKISVERRYYLCSRPDLEHLAVQEPMLYHHIQKYAINLSCYKQFQEEGIGHERVRFQHTFGHPGRYN